MLAKQFEHLDIQLILDLHCAAAHRDRIIGPELKRNVLLTMKEAVNNALKHSGANIIEVSLDLQHDRLALRVKDNGRGFDPTTVREGANGLMNFLKRAEAVHGEVQVNSGASGTEVFFTAPAPSTNM
jgi:signal transduction histidine kinase